MSIPPEIATLVEQLNQELNQTEQEASKGLNLVRQAMSRPNNALLIQFFAYFSAALFFVDNSKRRIQTTIVILNRT